MLGVNSRNKMVRPPCPFMATDERCGAETVMHNDAHTMVRCRKGHLTDVAQMPVPAEQIATPLIYRPQLALNPKNAVIAALVIDAIVRHL